MTKKKNINFPAILIAGTAAGIISGIVKLGWENLLPPRTSERNKTNPPQKLLEQMGVPTEVTHATYTYSGQQLPIVSYIMHFGFSISFALLYAILGFYYPKIKNAQGITFGLLTWWAFHLEILPKLKTIPSIENQPIEEHVSEALGHAVWMWTNDVFINELYSLLTKEP